MKRFFTICLLAFLLLSACAAAESLSLEEMSAAQEAASWEDTAETPDETAREEMINRILSTAKELYDQAGGKGKRAHYSGDIYVCKNFTVHLFKSVKDDFRMAEYPDVDLVIPNNP